MRKFKTNSTASNNFGQKNLDKATKALTEFLGVKEVHLDFETYKARVKATNWKLALAKDEWFAKSIALDVVEEMVLEVAE